MKIRAALTKEQGVTFAVVSVKRSALNPGTRDEACAAFQRAFPGVPIVLLAQDSRGEAQCYGRNDIVRFLGNVSIDRLPWREWTIAA